MKENNKRMIDINKENNKEQISSADQLMVTYNKIIGPIFMKWC